MTQLAHASASAASRSAQGKFAKRTQFAMAFTKGAFPANESLQSADPGAQTKFAKRTHFRPQVRGLKDLAHTTLYTRSVALPFEQARACVLREVRPLNGTEPVALADAAGRVTAEDVAADRDYPPFPRSARDGFAVRAADLSGELTVIGEVRAGDSFSGAISKGQAVQIMTGALEPVVADA